MKLNDTAQLLYAQYGTLTLNTRQLAKILHYRSPRVLLNAISAERCPVISRARTRIGTWVVWSIF